MKTISKKRNEKSSEATNFKPFFNLSEKSGDTKFFDQKSSNPFFTVQPKLTIGPPNDKFEQEADAMADQLVNESKAKDSSSALNPKIQAKCEDCEEEEAQAKFEIQRQEQEEEEELQMQPLEEEEEELQMQPLEEEEEELQMKENSHQTAEASPSFETKLRSQTSGGEPLSKGIRQEMEKGFGADFSNVNIHKDVNAEKLSASINAQAFTHGKDIYFNKGKYNPETSAGKHLLAHELTHTIQQKGESIQKLDDSKVSTPVPDTATKNKSTGIHSLTINDVKVEIHPDVFVKGKSGGETEISMKPKSWSYGGYETDTNGIITKVKNPPKIPKVIIKTTYGLTVKPSGTSAYGKGTTAADKKAGNTTLRFHEGSHGTDFLKYLTDNPFPKFPAGVGTKKADFLKAVETYKTARGEYGNKMDAFSKKRTDCVGYTIDKYHQANAKPGETFPIVCGS